MPAKTAIYLDSQSGAPLHPIAREALLSFLSDHHGVVPNSAAAHSYGRLGAKTVQNAAHEVLRSLGGAGSSRHLTWSSCGTDANQTAIRSVLDPLIEQGRRAHWMIVAGGHSSIESLAAVYEKRGVRITIVPLDQQGKADLSAAESALQPNESRLLSALWGCNVTGLIASHILNAKPFFQTHQIQLHIDLIASWGKTEISEIAVLADTLSISGHKVGALPGVGAVISRRALPKKAGTENLTGILALGAMAAYLRTDEWKTQVEHMRELRDRFEREVRTALPKVRINGADSERMPHVSNVTVGGLKPGINLVAQLDRLGIAVSAGPACQSAVPQPAPALLAMGVSVADALHSIRVSLHPATAWEDLAALIQALSEIARSSVSK